MANQNKWRNCIKCQAMFYDGHVPANKGRCPAGGGHEAAGFNFVLPHSRHPNRSRQTMWHNCMKCQTLFFSGHPHTNGVCPAGGGHVPAGFIFTLPHVTTPPPPRPSPPSPPPPPIISVSRSDMKKYSVTGSGFRNNTAVSIRISDGYAVNHYFHTRSSASGAINATFAVDCTSGIKLFFSASDGTGVPMTVDTTGQLWSNTVEETCQ